MTQIGQNVTEISGYKNDTKQRRWYILDANSGFITFFHILISIIVVPNVMMYLYVIAFGDSGTESITMALRYSEIIFMLEIV